ncbi:lasso peptide isopeptide bond-forming cyclase [Altericista sp. CCNU0014]|uniref:lasso peptide isopeptide bond-forming cyclase n=1 Tax=Altericista sp. CCNU0014 TaxID=3082949 RepID=UPI00384E8360
MSGILGILNRDGRPVEGKQLEAMSEAIAHRGPDGRRTWQSGAVGLGHRMLRTTPQSLLEELPSFDSAGQIAVTADLRLDNRAILIERLDLGHLPPQKVTDSQLVVAAYHRWGKSCPEYLLGDFAFAIWDDPAQTLFCARDHFGIKPFYFYNSHRLFAFASEIKALIALEDISSELNEIRVADCLTGTLDDPAITLYKDIWRLPPAHSLTLQMDRELRQFRYWALEQPEEIYHPSDEAYAEEYRHHFAEAVRCRMSSAYPVGAHLSGGLDSSSVACMARHLNREATHRSPIHTFSHTYPDVPDSDESDFIQIVLNQGDFIHHDIKGDGLGALTEWQTLFRATDDSLIGNAYFNWIVNRSAREHGVRVLMSGFDGDTTVGHGFLYLTELAHRQQWPALVREATQFVRQSKGEGASASSLIGRHSLPTLRKLARTRQWLAFARAVRCLSPALKASQPRLWYEWGFKEMDGIRQWRRWRDQKRQPSPPNPHPFANPTFLEEIHYAKRLLDLQIPSTAPQTERESQWRTLSSGLMVLPVEICDRMSAVCGVETRHPFMDKRLIEYCLALPARQKLSQGWSRAILRRGMEGILPPEIQWRSSKGSATAVFFYGLNKYDRPLLDEVVERDFPELARYIDVPHCKESYRRIVRGESQDIEGLWFAITLALWLRQFHAR